MKKKTFIVTIVAILIVALALGAGGFIAIRQHYENEYLSKIDDLNAQLKKKKTETIIEEKLIEKEVVISGLTIQCGLNNIGELAAAEYYYTHVATLESSSSLDAKLFKIPLGTAKAIFSYDGTIKAGIDFTQITVSKDDESKTITITVPHSRILTSEIDPDSFCLYDEKTNLFTKISVNEYAESVSEMMKEEEAKTIDKDLLKKADDHIAAIITNFVTNSYNLSDYTVTIQYI